MFPVVNFDWGGQHGSVSSSSRGWAKGTGYGGGGSYHHPGQSAQAEKRSRDAASARQQVTDEHIQRSITAISNCVETTTGRSCPCLVFRKHSRIGSAVQACFNPCVLCPIGADRWMSPCIPVPACYPSHILMYGHVAVFQLSSFFKFCVGISCVCGLFTVILVPIARLTPQGYIFDMSRIDDGKQCFSMRHVYARHGYPDIWHQLAHW